MKNGEQGNEYHHEFTIEPVPRIQIKGENKLVPRSHSVKV